MYKNLNELSLRILKKDNVTEEDVRQAFNITIANVVKSKHNVNINFRNEVATSDNRFIDSKYGYFIIEYKRPTVKISTKEREQLFSYLNDEKYFNKNNWGMLTNGKEVEIYNYDYFKNSFALNEDFSGELNESQINYISNLLANKDSLILTKENVNEVLGLENHKEIIRKMHHLLVNSSNNKTTLLYKEWLKLFNLSDEYDHLSESKKKPVIDYYEHLLGVPIKNITDEHQALFTVQTFYAIMLKLMAYKIIVNKTNTRFKKTRFIKDLYVDLENNKIFRKNNIINLVDGDFFSWYLNEFSEKEFNYFYDIIDPIVTIETKGIDLLFIKYYENIFPFNVRHSMGEFYTPSFLANKIVRTAASLTTENYDSIVLDPACGSGIFIINAFNIGYKNVYGIDINPLAVLTSKINYLLNNFDLSKMFELPIYLGDSTYIPAEIEINDVLCYEYDLLTSLEEYPEIKFTFPVEVVKRDDFFIILDQLEDLIVSENRMTAFELLKSYPEFQYTSLKKQYKKLFNILFLLEDKGLNSIWLKIIGNYFKAGSLKNIDIIIGNPPWVRWSNLPENYKNKIKDNCRVDGVFSGDSNYGGVDLNICALMAYVLIRDRLSLDGVLGFIMPDSIMFNKSFEGFRNMKFSDGKEFYLKKVERWNDPKERPFDPVTLDFAEYYFTFRKPKQIEVYDRKKQEFLNAFQMLDSFNNHYVIASQEDIDEIEKVVGKNSYRFRSGVNLLKGGHYLLEFHSAIDSKTSYFTPYENINGRLRLSAKKIRLENEIVHPYIRTSDINNDYIKKVDTFAIFPFPYGERNSYSLSEIRTRFPHFHNYFLTSDIQNAISSSSSYNKRIQKHKDFDIGIFRIGEYSYNDVFVITRDNTKADFSLVEKLPTPWGEEKMPIFDSHINFISRDLNNQPLKKDHAIKLFNAFNKEGVKKYIKASSDARSISSRLFNDIKVD